MEWLLAYLLYSFVQAILICKYDPESDHSFGWTMLLWFFAPMVTLVILLAAFYKSVIWLVKEEEEND